MKRFHLRLQLVAFDKKIEQSDLVRMSNKDKSTVSKWWNGEVVPGPKNTRLLSDILECDYFWLKTGKGHRTPREEDTKGISISNGASYIKAGRNAINAAGKKSKIKIGGDQKGLELTDIEAQAIQLVRKYGNEQVFKDIISKMEKIRDILDD